MTESEMKPMATRERIEHEISCLETQIENLFANPRSQLHSEIVAESLHNFRYRLLSTAQESNLQCGGEKLI